MSSLNLSNRLIRDFNFKVPNHIQDAFEHVEQELCSRGISFKIHFYISDEWFVADGQTSIALPFYLCDKKVKDLELKFLKRIEEKDNEYIKKIIRHEIAHCLDNAYGLRKLKKRQGLFGLSSTPYPDSYYPKSQSEEFVENLDDKYAQSHPEEDWAETFAVWLDPKSNWKNMYTSKALEKLVYLDSVMNSLDRRQKKMNNEQAGSYKEDARTLEQYFLEKTKLYKIKYKNNCLQKFQNIPRHLAYQDELKIINKLASNFVLKDYQVTPLYNAIKNTYEIKYSSKSLPDYKLMKFTDILIQEGTKNMFSEFHKVIV